MDCTTERVGIDPIWKGDDSDDDTDDDIKKTLP
jgi:hypothetical protein